MKRHWPHWLPFTVGHKVQHRFTKALPEFSQNIFFFYHREKHRVSFRSNKTAETAAKVKISLAPAVEKSLPGYLHHLVLGQDVRSSFSTLVRSKRRLIACTIYRDLETGWKCFRLEVGKTDQCDCRAETLHSCHVKLSKAAAISAWHEWQRVLSSCRWAVGAQWGLIGPVIKKKNCWHDCMWVI